MLALHAQKLDRRGRSSLGYTRSSAFTHFSGLCRCITLGIGTSSDDGISTASPDGRIRCASYKSLRTIHCANEIGMTANNRATDCRIDAVCGTSADECGRSIAFNISTSRDK